MPSLLLQLSDDFPFVENDSHVVIETNKSLLEELKMVFSSRSRFSYIEKIPLVNSSILNYGLNEFLLQPYESDRREINVEKRLKYALQRFEPRLNEVVINIEFDKDSDLFIEIFALYKRIPIKFELIWKECSDEFYFNE